MAEKRGNYNIKKGVVHIKSSFNNTIITITDMQGNTVSWASAGTVGFKGSRKSTPFAAQMAAEKAAKAAMDRGLKTVDVLLQGPGSGKEAAMRTIKTIGLTVENLRDITSLPHNGCRPPKRRRM